MVIMDTLFTAPIDSYIRLRGEDTLYRVWVHRRDGYTVLLDMHKLKTRLCHGCIMMTIHTCESELKEAYTNYLATTL